MHLKGLEGGGNWAGVQRGREGGLGGRIGRRFQGTSQAKSQRTNPGSRAYSNQVYDPAVRRPKLPLVVAFSTLLLGVLIGKLSTIYETEHTPSEHVFPLSSKSELKDMVPPHYGGALELLLVIQGCSTFLKPHQISRDEKELILHADTYWNTHHAEPGQISKYVLYPESTEQVSEIMKLCHQNRIPVVPTSGMTSLEGHFIPVRGGVTIDFSRMDKIIALHKDDLDVVVQPGVGWEDLDEYLADYGLIGGIDPGPGAQIGGCIANSCSGTKALKTGTMKENVKNLTVVLADGSIIKTKMRSSKSSAGYNLNGLFIGSEGTLGLVTEATLKLHVKPKVEQVAVVSFPTIETAANVCSEVVSRGIDVNAMEIVDDKMMHFINKSGQTERVWDELTTLFFKIGGESKDEVQMKVKRLVEICKLNKNLKFEFAQTAEEKEELWSARKVALWSTINYGRQNISPDIEIWTTDVAVPISQLRVILSNVKLETEASGLNATLVGHAGDGNFHSFLLYRPEEREIASKLVDRMVQQALALEGTCTGEHAIGYGKREYLVEELGEDTIDVMRKLKMALDPLRILNPDKIFKTDPHDHGGHGGE